jgi:hypothetical protein
MKYGRGRLLRKFLSDEMSTILVGASATTAQSALQSSGCPFPDATNSTLVSTNKINKQMDFCVNFSVNNRFNSLPISFFLSEMHKILQKESQNGEIEKASQFGP